MNDKTLEKSSLEEKPKISNSALELTQKVQMHFPRGLNPRLLSAWNGVPMEYLDKELFGFFNRYPNPALKLSHSMNVGEGSGGEFFVRNKFAEEEWIAGNDFKRTFFGSKVKALNGSVCLKQYRLLRDRSIRDILDEINFFQDNHLMENTTLKEILILVELQNDGSSGTLLSDGKSNLFVIEDSMVDVLFDKKWTFAYCPKDGFLSVKEKKSRIFVRYKK